jgi:hypothetical protein
MISGGDRAQQAAPGKLDVQLVSYAIQLFGQLFNGSLHKENIRQAALSGLSMNLFGNLFQGPRVRVDPDIKFSGIPAPGLIDKAAIAGPYVYYNPLAMRRDKLSEFLRVNSSDGASANSSQHRFSPSERLTNPLCL